METNYFDDIEKDVNDLIMYMFEHATYIVQGNTQCQIVKVCIKIPIYI
jgi:hypothetical protein